MKTKFWIGCLSALLVASVALSVWLLWPGQNGAYAEVWSDGELLYTVSLAEQREMRIESQWGVNVVTVRDGKIAVTQADCPDHYCMKRGFCAGGTQIVCLPNRLVIRFVGEQEIDGVVG